MRQNGGVNAAQPQYRSVLQGLHNLPLASEACSHAQIGTQILVCDVQQEVSIHLELLHSKGNVRHIVCHIVSLCVTD